MADIRVKKEAEYDGRMINAIREMIGLQPLYFIKRKGSYNDLSSCEKWAGELEITSVNYSGD